ncbi:SCO2322 family protein [Nonomuraea sp. NPDC049028]|uniref:SCO2322 family protein n=1 Tax=Nonomuraea sp. NPDC049028 TaxID=3364348 RepID=UPI00371E198F
MATEVAVAAAAFLAAPSPALAASSAFPALATPSALPALATPSALPALAMPLALPALAAFSVFPALATPSVGPSDPVPGAPDPNAVRLWSVWQSDGTAWLASSAKEVPPDGSVIGWRFSASPDGTATEPPGGDLPSFQTVCGKDAAASGSKRVVVRVDFGDPESDAFPGEQPPAEGLTKCVTGAETASTAQLLATAAKARVNAQGDVVAINAYPAGAAAGIDLGTPASPADSSSDGASSDGPPLTLIWGGAVALVLLSGGAIVATRRHPRTPSH